MARNHPVPTFGAFGSAVLAVFLGGVAAFVLRAGSSAERHALYGGLAALAASLGFGVIAGVGTWNDRTQPSITVTPRGATVTVGIRGSGLRASDHIVVEVEQLVRGADDRGQPTWVPAQPLYGASLGPNASGDVAQTVDLTLPPGDFDDLGARAWVGDEPARCYTRGNTTGCVRVHIPRPAERPQLAVDWETFVRVPRLGIRLRAKNLPARPARSMTLRVYGIAAGQPQRTLAEWSLAPDAGGVFDRRLSVVVGRTFTDVCVVASVARRDPTCPAAADAETVWSRLAVPPAQ
jgi:hypothetical protein